MPRDPFPPRRASLCFWFQSFVTLLSCGPLFNVSCDIWTVSMGQAQGYLKKTLLAQGTPGLLNKLYLLGLISPRRLPDPHTKPPSFLDLLR